ncbi:MAG: PilZ domain-containing protein [Proteobacteria bacterium]|nr:PilZ domain-containing protein [Pseudomonadota bacterium]MDA1352502.1 PilZ domain-containing protein [Pseudomonadota bacterium]
MEKDKLGLATKRIVGDILADSHSYSCSLNIKNQNDLYQHFMPFVKAGGFFVPSKHSFALGDEVQLRLSLFLVEELIVVEGKAIWVSFNGDSSLDSQGVGIQLSASESEIVTTIRSLLDDMPQNHKSTLTM